MMNNKKYYLGDLYPAVYFTLQEAKCMYHALHGLNNIQTAKAMRLSERTVGHYFEVMRHKVNASHKKWLIEKIKKTDFMQYMGELLALEQNQKKEMLTHSYGSTRKSNPHVFEQALSKP